MANTISYNGTIIKTFSGNEEFTLPAGGNLMSGDLVFSLDGTATLTVNYNGMQVINTSTAGTYTMPCSGELMSGNVTGNISSVAPSYEPYLTFSSPSSFTLETKNGQKNWDGTLEYSTDAQNWNTWVGTNTISSAADGNVYKLYLRGTNNTYITGANYNGITLTGQTISCIGSIEMLLDYASAYSGNHPSMASHCFQALFSANTSLISAPDLPATTLADYCYSQMFAGCISLVSAPNLPATMLAVECYGNMFNGCTSLITAPALPATRLVELCYYGMFCDCISLVSAPNLPATTLADGCYEEMFYVCTSLITAPALPATTLRSHCYAYMFFGCTSLETIPELSATTLPYVCYERMFEGCTKIKLSMDQSETYVNPYRIPSSGEGQVTGNNAVKNMFKDTGGTFTGTPDINTTYYTSNTIVPAA